MTDINVMIIIYRVPQKKFLLDFFLNVCSLLISCCRLLILLFAVIRSRHKEREMSRQSREILKGTFLGHPVHQHDRYLYKVGRRDSSDYSPIANSSSSSPFATMSSVQVDSFMRSSTYDTSHKRFP